MFFRRRQTEEYEDEAPEEPFRAPRGKGGGKLRTRPQRKTTRRRKMGPSEYLTYGVLGFALTFLFEHFIAKQTYISSVVAGIATGILLVLWTAFMEGRRRGKGTPSGPTKKR